MARPRDPRLDARIRRAGLDAIEEDGYGAFSVDGVARRAGVPKTTVYARWPSRTALLDDLLAERLRTLHGDRDEVALEELVTADLALLGRPEGRAVVQALLAARDADGDPVPQLAAALDAHRDRYRVALARLAGDASAAAGGGLDAAAGTLLAVVWGGTVLAGPGGAPSLDRVLALVPALLAADDG